MKTLSDIKGNKYLMSLIGTWAGCILLIGAGYYLLHMPKKDVLMQVGRQYSESKELLETAQMATRDDICQKIKQSSEETAQKITNFSVSQDDITGLVFEIGKIANELGLAEFSSKNQREQSYPTVGKDSMVTEAWLEVEFKSSFCQFAQFVNRLERGAPAVFVEKTFIRRDESGMQKHDVKLWLSFLTTKEGYGSVAIANPR